MENMKGRNLVIDGDYKFKLLDNVSHLLKIRIGLIKCIKLNQDTVENYEIKEERPINDVYVVLFNFKDGKKSLIEMDGEQFMKFKRIFSYSINM